MSIQRILIFRAGAVGDFIVTLPALASLRSAYPDASIDLVGYPERAILARPLVNRIHDVDAAQWSALFARGSDLSLLTPILADVDLAIAYMNDPDGAVGLNLRQSGVRQVVFHSPRPEEKGRTHAIDHLLEPVESLGITHLNRTPEIVPDRSSTHAARAILEDAGVGGPYGIIHAGAGGANKQWLPDSFARVAEALWQTREWPLVITSGPADGDLAETICRGADAHAVPLKPVDLVTLSALYADARIYLGCDTGPSHLSAATGTASVVLFGPTHPRVWAPRGPNVHVIRAPGGVMDALEPATVVQAIQTHLGDV